MGGMADLIAEEHKLPSAVPEIHLGFLSRKFYVGHTDISRCTKVEIVFDGDWLIRTEWKVGDKIVSDEKRYKNFPCECGIHEKENTI